MKDATPSLPLEVFEHVPRPAETVSRLFAANADLIAFSTLLYEGQGAGDARPQAMMGAAFARNLLVRVGCGSLARS